jgi:hypothetical protein
MSTPAFAVVDAPFRDSILYQGVNGVFITGKVQSDFTIRLSKDGVGGQSTTGITLTEVSAANNPGEYAIYIPAAILTDVGTYVLTVTDTATPLYTWEQVYTVTNAGLPSTAGVGFTATTGDGRAYDGANPVGNATVVIAAGGTVHASLTTNALGMWGPVYFTADGTYVVTVQKAGYVSAQGTIVVTGSGTVATGPGTDLVVATSTVNDMSAAELWAYASRMARDVSGPKADIERKQAVQDAIDMLAKERQWPHLLRRASLQLNNQSSLTCSFTVGSSTCTLTGGAVVPAWVSATNVPRILFNNRLLNVTAATAGATTLTLETPYQDSTSPVTGTLILFQDEYKLPDDFLMFGQIIPGQRWGQGAMNVGIEKFYQLQTVTEFGMRMATAYCIHNQRLMLYPYPNISTELLYTYYKRPAKLTSASDIVDWDPAQTEVVRRAIDLQVAIRYGSFQGGTKADAIGAYKEALTRSVNTSHSTTMLPNALDDVDTWSQRLNRTDWHRRS